MSDPKYVMINVGMKEQIICEIHGSPISTAYNFFNFPDSRHFHPYACQIRFIVAVPYIKTVPRVPTVDPRAVAIDVALAPVSPMFVIAMIDSGTPI